MGRSIWPGKRGQALRGAATTPYAVLLALALFLAVFPRFLDSYSLHIMVMVVMYATLALSWDILGRTGQLSLAHAGFFGLGAYTAALLCTKADVPQVLSIAMAGACSALVAAGLGAITLRLTAIYFSIATLAFGEVLRTVALRFEGLTGGPIGISVPLLFGGNRLNACYLVSGVLLLAVYVSMALDRSRFRFAFNAIRTRGHLSSVFGVDVVQCKIGAFMVSAMFAGLAGGFYIHYISYTIPYEAFDLGISISSLVMCIFGGLHTTAGPLVGAVILKLVEEYLRITIKYGYMIAYGVILVVVVLFLPHGLVGVVRKWLSSKRITLQRGSAGLSR